MLIARGPRTAVGYYLACVPPSNHSSARPRPGSRGRTAIRRRRLAAAGAAVLLVAVALVFLLLPRGPSALKPPPSPAHHHPKPARCPLTGVLARGGKIPARPALAVKIGNEPYGARPQSGLNEADIVYDTPAEGGIMRYVAVYQCHSASSIGPTRSVRWVDWHILQAFGRPILAFAGGINPDVDAVDGLRWLLPADLLTSAQGAGVRISSRVPPDNLYTSTAALWALSKTTSPPPPVFSYTALMPSLAKPASALTINFSEGTDVTWKWDGRTGSWSHTYGGTPDIDVLTDQPVTTTNIVVQIVHYSFGRYAESPGGTGDVESQTVGSGPGYVLRGGKEIEVTWHRPSLSAPTTFTAADGQAVGLARGRTWVELVLNTTAKIPGALTITP